MVNVNWDAVAHTIVGLFFVAAMIAALVAINTRSPH